MNENTKAIIDTTAGRAWTTYQGSRELYEMFADKGATWLVCTPAQASAFDRVVEHQGREHYRNAYGDSFGQYVAVEFAHIFIGIEPDGYTHS
jgi:hypothetical protein